MNSRRQFLMRAAGATLATSGLTVATAALTQVETDRSSTLIVDNDDEAVLSVVPSGAGTETDAVRLETGSNNETFVFDATAFPVPSGATAAVGTIDPIQFSPDKLVEEAFKITNNGSNSVDVRATLTLDGSPASSFKILLAGSEPSTTDFETATAGNTAEVTDVASNGSVYGAFVIDTDGGDIGGDLTGTFSIEAIDTALTN
jgi:hypothetical protein